MITRPGRAWRSLLAVALAATGVLAADIGGTGHGGGDTGSAGAAPAQTSPQVETIATGLAAPWGIDFLPDGSALVTERDSARLLRVSPAGEVTEIGTVEGVAPGGEGGLLGLAISPDYATDNLVYLYYTAANDNRIVRATYDGTAMGPQEVVLDGIPKGLIHNGGRIAFGPDGMLYAGVGETGDTALAQDLASLGGKILRMTPAGDPAPGNPFDSLVWTYGHRNVQGLAWDDQGRLFATEFGQNTFDEVNRIEAGGNYGWPDVEGTGGGDEYVDPLVTWSTAEASPSGAAILDGSLWVAALRGRRLWELPLTGDGGVGTPVAHLTDEYGRLRNAAAAPDGRLWVSTSNRDGRGTPAADDDRILALTLGGDEPPPPSSTTTTATTPPTTTTTMPPTTTTTTTTPPDPTCVTAANAEHVDAGRARNVFIFVVATGSGDFLGLRWSTSTTSLSEASPGVWERVDSCP